MQKERTHKEELEKFLQTKADIEAREIAIESQEKAFDAIKEKLMAASAELAQKKADLFKEAEKLASGLYQDRLTAVESEAKKIIESAQASSEKTRAEAEIGAQKIRALRQQNLHRRRSRRVQGLSCQTYAVCWI